jgi:hypothetical protein
VHDDQRWIAEHFLEELHGVFNKDEPLYKTDLRWKYAEMVLHEIPGDDLEEIAVRDTAQALIDVWTSPGDAEAIERFLNVRRAHLGVLKSLFNE